MNSDDLCLSIDLGTGGPKIGLVTLDGELLAHELHSVSTHFAEDGEATQDAGQWWTIVCDATRRLMRQPGVTPERVKAVAVTGQYVSTVPVDEHGVPTGPCMTFLDTRGRRYSREAIGGAVQGFNGRRLWQFIRKTGGAPSTSGDDSVGHILFMTNEQPEMCARTRWFLEPVDYLTMRFCGVASGTHASRIGLWLTDNRRLDHYDYDPQLLRAVGISKRQLPPLVPTGTVLGPVTKDVATSLGLDESTVVLTGLPDLHAAAYGTGATGLFDAHIAISTTSWVSCPVAKKKTDLFHTMASVPGLTNDSYIVINNQDTGAKALEWFQGILAGQGNRLSFTEMTALAATSPAGARGVLFTPWLMGERSPIGDRLARAGFTNLSMTTNTADMIRAVMEGVAANSAWLFRYVEKFTGQTLSPVRMIGGGAQSSLWCQIFADTLGREVHQVKDPMFAQLRGMALMASVSLGRRRFEDLKDVVTPVEVFRPSPHDEELYRERAGTLASLYQRDRTWRRRQRKRRPRTPTPSLG
jgi:xylulokinase